MNPAERKKFYSSLFGLLFCSSFSGSRGRAREQRERERERGRETRETQKKKQNRDVGRCVVLTPLQQEKARALQQDEFALSYNYWSVHTAVTIMFLLSIVLSAVLAPSSALPSRFNGRFVHGNPHQPAAALAAERENEYFLEQMVDHFDRSNGEVRLLSLWRLLWCDVL